MNKFFLLTFALTVSLVGSIVSNVSAASVDAEADNLNVVSPEQQAEILKNYNKRLYYRVNNYSPDKLKAVINNTNKIDNRYVKRDKKKAAADKPVNVDDKVEVKSFFKSQIKTDSDGPAYFD